MMHRGVTDCARMVVSRRVQIRPSFPIAVLTVVLLEMLGSSVTLRVLRAPPVANLESLRPQLMEFA